MKSCIILFFGFFYLQPLFAQDFNSNLALIPKPQKVEFYNGHLKWQNDFPVFSEKELDSRVVSQLNLMCIKGGMISADGVTEKIISFRKGSFEGDSIVGSYRLLVNENGVDIFANSSEGQYYALLTLSQLFSVDSVFSDGATIPFAEIEDYPTFVWRGMHLDVSRHFFDVEFIKSYIRWLSFHKLNKFHWHLTDDQGWRIEIKKYPELTEKGAYRKETILAKNFNPYIGDSTPYGGFYTQEQIKEIVEYASNYFVEIIPEIEMPGHSVAAISSYPWLSCKQEPIEVATKWGVFDDVLCAGNDSVFKFLEDILDEVTALFPSKYIHVGGDECPKTRWETCEKCQKRMHDEHLNSEHELQSYFIQRIEKYLNSKGRVIIGWDEILEGGLAPNAVVMSWRGEDGGIEAANASHQVIMSPGKPCYFDHYQSQNTADEPLAIGGYNGLKAVYDYKVIPESLNKEKQIFILGAQANVWTEYMLNSKQVEYMIFPRMSALSEALWLNSSAKDYSDFKARLKVQVQRYNRWGVSYRSLNLSE
ncbi:MAG: beta-N-acetylhexosaminidase [Bacteroidales bacterium]|nr:beta-N-acetylhexosaminidase [Bacteroidales bacterium]